MGRTGVVTIRDVARECGYSASTVSIVLNGAPLSRYIPADTKGRIETAAKRMGYRPNPLARSLRSQRSNIIGVMVIDITDPFCTPIRTTNRTDLNGTWKCCWTGAWKDWW